MIVLITFAFLAGVITVLSPCILPILPIILSSSIGGENTGKARPFGVVIGFVLSFTFFTLFLSTLVSLLGVPANTLRIFSIVVITGFGISLLVPQFQLLLEKMFSRLTGFVPQNTGKKGFGAGFVLGISLGLLWTPCVGPILASVISLALTGSVTLAAFFITFAYAAGTAIPMLAIMWGGRELLHRVPWLLKNTGNIQKGFGVVMILVAVAIATNADRSFQTYIIEKFPQYGVGLTKIEERSSVLNALDKIGSQQDNKVPETGKPMFELLNPKGEKAPELIPGGIWLNSPPLKLSDLRGKVVVIDFWTYSCINCQRTLPYLRTWHEKYSDDGLVIIGVHAPEFEFEKSESNLKKAVVDFGLKYPIVQDNDFATWRAYNNRFWPAKYFIDKDGYIRYEHFGEGAYDESERVIQKLLKEAGASNVNEKISNPDYQNYSRTPETYLGYARIVNFSSPERIAQNIAADYAMPEKLPRNGVAYSGEWLVASEYANPSQGAKLAFDFEAKQVFLVIRPEAGTAQVRVLVDGKMQYFGADTKDGLVTVNADRLYNLVTLPSPGRHVLELEFLDGNAEAYAFTFG